MIGLMKKIYHYIKKNIFEVKKRFYYKWKNEPAHQYLHRNETPKLTKEQILEIDSYWKQYGIKFKDYSWFRWYGGVQNTFSPKYIPNDVYAYIIWPYYNNEEFCEAYKDKNFFERFMPDIPFPEAVLRRIHGRYYDAGSNFCDCLKDDKKIISLLLNAKEVIVKDAWDSGEGRGVKKYQIKTEQDARRLLEEWDSDNFIVQKVVQQNACFAQFNESSVNVMRITSWYHDGKVEILAPTLRVGIKGKVTDICFIDGIEMANVIGITSDGYFKPYMVTQDGKKQEIARFAENADMRIPCWDEIIRLIKENHPKLGHFDLIGWDFTVTDENKVVCIEYNIRRPGTVFYQYVNGPFFGEYTEEVLSFLKDKKNQDKYIPKWLRA